jgi:hypothetical protein
MRLPEAACPLESQLAHIVPLTSCDSRFGRANVGLQTGDASLNPDAGVVVMTTEILRNILYRSAAAAGGEEPGGEAAAAGAQEGAEGEVGGGALPTPALSVAAAKDRLKDVGLVVLDEVR